MEELETDVKGLRARRVKKHQLDSSKTIENRGGKGSFLSLIPHETHGSMDPRIPTM